MSVPSLIYFCSLQTTVQNLHQINVNNDLFGIQDSTKQPFDHQSDPITTKTGLMPLEVKVNLIWLHVPRNYELQEVKLQSGSPGYGRIHIF